MIEFLFLALLFGAFPVAFITRSDEEYKIFGFVIIAVVLWGFLGFIGQLWPLLFLIPCAWHFALSPLFKKKENLIDLNGR